MLFDRAQIPQRRLPETIVLGVRPGATPSDRPPVRIFLGTEPAQYRAERVFLWSIEQVRDPGRVYEIHRMESLAGFTRLFWNTGFTNYRFAVPHFAGRRGRAIYNDVDQVYLSDPAELFDAELGEHGFLALSETESSVMLIDCEKMARVWTLEAARSRLKRSLLDAALATPGCCGALDPAWNARDHEYVPGRSKLLHYTTLHRQPWRPFPERFYYQPHPEAEPWLEREREADRAGYRPRGDAESERFTALRAHPRSLQRCDSATLDAEIRELVERSDSRRLLRVSPCPDAETQAPRERQDAWAAKEVADAGLFELGEPPAPGACPAPHEGVVCTARLDELPIDDLPRVVSQLFERASRFVFATVRLDPPSRRRFGAPPRGSLHQPEWWQWLFTSAAARHPGVHWRIACVRSGASRPAVFESRRVELLQGGAFVGLARGDSPRVWVLTDHKPGHTTQSEGLAEELGWPHERIDLEFNPLQELPNAWTRRSRLTLTPASAARLEPPWPDLVIATGRRTAPVASWIRRRSRARTRTVQMGRLGAFHRDVFDLAVAPAYACLYPDPRRVETAAPVTRVSAKRLESAAAQWAPALSSSALPRLALLVGGRDAEHELRSAQARRLGEDVADLARRESGAVWVTTSRRTRPRRADEIESALGETVARFHRWQPNGPASENPYLGYLALADAFVVTGESASMLAEACATGKPVYVYPLAERSPGAIGWARRSERWLADRVTARARARPRNRRDFERPQRGLEWLCAMLLAHGFVRTTGHSRRLHETLVARGLARIFDGKLAPPPADRLSDARVVASRVRELMGMPGARADQSATGFPTGSSPPPYP